jgi:hypothetical protein
VEVEDRETIRHMSNTLDKILTVLSKPSSRLARVFELAAAGVGILGILSIIDILKNWIGG